MYLEEEKDGRITFLDVLVERSQSKLYTSVNRKETHTNRYINFNSHHHRRILAGVMKQRAEKTCHLSRRCREMEEVFVAKEYLVDLLS